jgi:hypothetical protein
MRDEEGIRGGEGAMPHHFRRQQHKLPPGLGSAVSHD